MVETTFLILAGLIVAVIAMFLVNRFQISLFGFKLSFNKSDRLNQVHQLVHLAKDYQNNVYEYNNNILKHQMTTVEGLLLKIEDKLLLEFPLDKVVVAQNRAHTFLKDCLVKNGFADLSSSEFHSYVCNKIIEIRKQYDTWLGAKSDFIDSHEFSSIISDIFTHANTCHTYWLDKIKESTLEYNKAYDALIKQIGG